jgi:hypothetical protein
MITDKDFVWLAASTVVHQKERLMLLCCKDLNVTINRYIYKIYLIFFEKESPQLGELAEWEVPCAEE